MNLPKPRSWFARTQRTARLRRDARRQLRSAIEPLEARCLLASDFVYDRTGALLGFDARLQYDSTSSQIQLVSANNSSTILHALAVNDFSGKVDIRGSLGADSVVFDPSLSNLPQLGPLLFSGADGKDTATFQGALNTNGNELRITAETIALEGSASLSTQKLDANGIVIGNSGDISLVGTTLRLAARSALLADVGSSTSLVAGAITLSAKDAATAGESIVGDLLSPVLVTDRQASITTKGAKLAGGDISLSVTTSTQTRWGDVSSYANEIATSLFGTLSSIADVALSLLSPLSGQVKIQKATGNLSLTDTTLDATGTVSLIAMSTADAGFTTVGVNNKVPINGSLAPFIISVGYGETVVQANVMLDGTTKITAKGDITVKSESKSDAAVTSRGTANGRFSNSDSVDYAISLAIANTQSISTVSMGKDAEIFTSRGSVSVVAKGESSTEVEAESQVFRDGVAGLAVGVSVDKATVTNDVLGKITAANPTAAAPFEFQSTSVNSTTDTITLSNLQPDRAIKPWQELVYRVTNGQTIPGLEDGQTYYAESVENVPAGDAFTGTQRVRLAKTLPLSLDADQTLSDSTHTLAKLQLKDFPASAVGKDTANNLTLNLPDISGLSDGMQVKYVGPNSPVTVRKIAGTVVRSAAGDQITRTDGGDSWKGLGLYKGQTIKLTEAGANNGDYTIKDFSPDGLTLILVESNRLTAGTLSSFTLETTPAEPKAIGNLQQGSYYQLSIQNGVVRLRDPQNNNNLVTFAGAGSGIHGLFYSAPAKSFLPKVAVDTDRKSLKIPNHGFQTGDLLVYHTDPTQRLERTVSYFDVNDPTNPQRFGTTSLPDAPIDGLDNGYYYYVARADADHIYLSESSVAAARATAIDLGTSTGGAFALSPTSDATGITIQATLEATNGATAGVSLSDGEQPWLDVGVDASTNSENLLALTNALPISSALRSGFSSKVPSAPARPSSPAPSTTKTQIDQWKQDAQNGLPLQTNPTQTETSAELAGTFAINVYDHDVRVNIGSTAVLRSGKDINISSEISENFGLASISEATRNGLDSADTSNTGARREDVEISVAFAYGHNKNHARAIVADGAVLDAVDSISVTSTVSYPLKVDSADALLNPVTLIQDSALDTMAFLLDGTLGASTNLFNTEVSAIGGDPGSNSADKFVLGLALSVTSFDNESVARVGAAKINQDVTLQNSLQQVTVQASTLIDMVEVGHNAAFNLSLPGIGQAGWDAFTSGDPLSALQGIVNPFGASGQSAIGASVLVMVADNQTVAEIEDNAVISTGIAGTGLTVDATQTIMSVAVSQTGSQASEFGLSPSVSVAYYTTETKAHIGALASISGGDIHVLANDTVNRYGIDGGYVTGNKNGIGAAVGVNYFDRLTAAYIGNDSINTDAVPAGSPATIGIDGDLVVKANQQGNIFALALAGTYLSEPENKPTTQQTNNSANPNPSPLQGVSAAVGASVAYNRVKTAVMAFIDDPSIEAETVTVDATNSTVVRAIVVGGAINNSQSGSGGAMAGAFAINDLSGGVVLAYLRDADITTTGTSTTTPALKINASNTSTIYADGGGIALVISQGASSNSQNISAGISVALNDIGSDVLARIENSTVDASGNVEVTATFVPTIDALTLAGAGSVSTGPKTPSNGEPPAVLSLTGAGAGSKNVIRGKVRAEILNSDPTNQAGITTGNAGKVTLTATDKSKVIADGGAVALSLALSATGEFTNLGFAVSAAINEITTDTIAQIENSSLQVGGDLIVEAIASPTIDALTIGGALTNGGSVSGAGSGNTIRNKTQALISGGSGAGTQSAIEVKGDTTVKATDTSHIIADAGGVSIVLNIFSRSGEKLSASIGVAAAFNTIENHLSASVNDTTLSSQRLDVTAKSEARIEALTLAGAGAVSVADDSIFSFNGAGAGSKNRITNTVEASLADLKSSDGPTSIQTTVGNIHVKASDQSKITANAGGVAFGFGLGQDASNVNLSVGVSLALNDIRNTVQSFIKDASITSLAALTVDASSDSKIESLTIAGAGSVGLRPSGNAGFGLQMAGAGTGSGNTIDGTTQAYISGAANVNTGGGNSLTVSAQDTSTIVAKAIAGSLAMQLDSGGSLAIGASIADNRIDSDVLAYIDRAIVSSTGSLSLTATSKVNIEATTVAAAISATVNPGEGVSLAGAGAGAQSYNTITNTTEAYIKGGANVSTLGANDVTASAKDESTIRADAGGGSLAVSAQPKGFSGAFGISAALSTNTITNTIRAYVEGATTQVSAGRDLFVTTDSTSKINAISVSVAGAVALTNPLAGFSLAMAGAGSQSINKVANTIHSFVTNQATARATRSVSVSAMDDSAVRSDVPAVSFVVSLGVGLSTSATVSQNTVDNKVAAFFGPSKVDATAGNIAVAATSNAKVEAFSTAVSLNISIGASGQGGKTLSQVIGSTKAYANPGASITATEGKVSFDALTTAYTNAEAKGGGLGLISVTGLEAESKITASTEAFVTGPMTMNAGDLSVTAKARGKDGVTQRTALSKVTAGTVAIVGGGGGKATSTVSGPVQAYLGDLADININRRILTTGAIEVLADSNSKAVADSPGGSGGGVTVTALIAEATTSGLTRAYVGRANLLASSVDVNATAKNWADAHILVADIGIVTGGGGKATAKQMADTEAAIADNAGVLILGSGTVSVKADAESKATSEAKGGGFGIFNSSVFEALSSIGDQIGTTIDRASTTATVGGAQIFGAGNLIIDANSRNTSTNNLNSVSIGGAGIGSTSAAGRVLEETLAFLGIAEFSGYTASINVQGTVQIHATTDTIVTSDQTAGGGGGLAIASAKTDGIVNSQNLAYIGNGSSVTAGAIDIRSTLTRMQGDAKLLAATGGVVSIGTTRATLDMNPAARAFIGHGATINSGNVDVRATGRAEGDARSQSSGGGAVQIGVAYAKTTVNPIIDAYIGSSATVNASGNVTVNAQLSTTVTPPPRNTIEDSLLDDDSLAVDIDRDTVDFAIPVATGDTLTYDAPNATSSFGLVHGRTYHAIVVKSGQSLQLGEEFEASLVNGLTDEIVFSTPHAFQPGDAVRYDARGALSLVEPWQTSKPTNDPLYVNPDNVLYVRGIFTDPNDPATLDRTRIRLATTRALAVRNENELLKPFQATTAIAPATSTITLAGHGFLEGQPVTYRAAASAAFLTEAADATVIDRSVTQAGKTTQVKDVQRDSDQNVIHVDNNRIFLPQHSFQTGDAVTYTSNNPIGGLTNDSTYYVIVVDGNQIQLARTYFEAMGRGLDDRGNSDPADDIVAIPVRAIPLNPTGNQKQVHNLSRNLVGLRDLQTYYVTNVSTNTFQLRTAPQGPIVNIDFADAIVTNQRDGQTTSTDRIITRDGAHRLGTLGIDLRAGSDTQSLRIDLTGQPDATAHRFLGATAAPAAGDGVSSATAIGGSGAALDIAAPTGVLYTVPTVKAHIDAIEIRATGNIQVSSFGASSNATKGDTGGGGIASIGEAHADTLMTSAPTEATIGSRTILVAGGSIIIQAESDHTTSATARSVGGGAFAVKVAETTSKLNADTKTHIGDGASLSATGQVSVISSAKFNGTSNSETYSVALGAFADSDNTNNDRGVDIDSPSRVIIGKGAKIVAETVNLQAVIPSAKANARAWAESFSPVLLGVATAFADAYAQVDAEAKVIIEANPIGTSLQTQIIGTLGVDIQARKPTVDEIVRDPHARAVALIPPQRARRLGSTNISGTVQASEDARVVAGTRLNGTPLQSVATIPQLALYVQAADTTTWDADVIVTGAKPELIVDDNGQITRQRNLNAVVDTAAGTVTVTGINNAGPGQVLFAGGQKVAGRAGTFSFQATTPSIDITTGKYTLVLGNLSATTSTAGQEPKVTLDVPEVAIEFDVLQDFQIPTFNITNLDTNPTAGVGILLTGLIDNPGGWVRLSTSGGGIYSQNFAARQGAIRANRLSMDSAGNIGGTVPGSRDRIALDFIEGINLPAYAQVNAASNINVGLQALRRGIAAGNFTALADPLGSQFNAGGSADIMLLAGVDQRLVDTTTNVGIQVFETSRVTKPERAPAPTNPARSPRTTVVTNHFRVSSGGALGRPAILYATGSTPLDVTYNLGIVRGQSSINIYKLPSTTSTVNIVSQIGYQPGSNIPHVSANTNGSIKLDEVVGELQLGDVTSTTSDVSLRSAGSILDRFVDSSADVTGNNVTLVSLGTIGNVNPLHINSSASAPGMVNASAVGNIRLTEVDDSNAAIADTLRIGLIDSAQGNVWLTANAGALVDVLNDSEADVVGNLITLVATSIGQVGNPLEIDSSNVTNAGLFATASGDIRLTETKNHLYIGDVRSTTGDVFLTVLDDETDLNSMQIEWFSNDVVLGGTISGRNLQLIAGDDFILNDVGSITATGSVSIQIDPSFGDPDDDGASVLIDTQITATALNLAGGDDFDTFSIVPQRLVGNATVNIAGSLPAYPTFPGDRLFMVIGDTMYSPPPTNDQSLIETGSGVLTAAGYSPISYTSIERIDRQRANEPPMTLFPNSFCLTQSSVEFSQVGGNNLSVIDYDLDSVTLELVVYSGPSNSRTAAGTLQLAGNSIVATGNGTPGNPLRFSGTLTAVNAALATGLIYTPTPGLLATVTIESRSSDSTTSNTNSFSFAVGCDLNNLPINILPPDFTVAASTSVNTITMAGNNNRRLSVADPDAGDYFFFVIEMTVPVGKLNVLNAPIRTGDGTPSNPLRIMGPLSTLNFWLDQGLFLELPSGFVGDVPLTITSNDGGATGTGGVKSDTDVLMIRVRDLDPANNAPVNYVPANLSSSQPIVEFSQFMGRPLTISDIDAGAASNFTVTLSSNDTKLSLANTSAISVTGQGTANDPLVLVGTLANVNAALLAGLFVQTVGPNPLGTKTITVTSNDQGNSGTGGPKQDIDSWTVTFANANTINDPPTNLLPNDFSTSTLPIVLSQANGNALAVLDVDAGSANNFLVSLSVPRGILQLIDRTGVLAVSGTGTVNDPLRLEGTLGSINTALARGLQFIGSGDGPIPITMVSNDRGNSGSGGEKTDTDTLTITLLDPNLENDAPVNHLPDAVLTSQTEIIFSRADNNALTVTDIDAGTGTIEVSFTTTDGRLSLLNSSAVSSSGTGTPASPLKLSGNIDAINSVLLAGLKFVAQGGFTGATSIVMTSNDLGNTGTGGPKQDRDALGITIIDNDDSRNAPPINHLPGNVTAFGAPVLFSEQTGNMLAVTDIDAGQANNFQVALSVSRGFLQLSDATGVAYVGNGSATNPLALVGKLADIDRVLAAGVLFIPGDDPGQSVTLTVVSNDRGNTGSGGELTDTDSLTITLVDVDPANNNPPENHLPAPVVSDQLPLILSYANRNNLFVTDVDAGDGTNFEVHLSVPVGRLSLVDDSGVLASGSGTTADPLVMKYTLASINRTLAAGVQFLPPVGFLGTTTLTITSIDNGQTGAGALGSDTDTLELTIIDSTTLNDPPVNHLPAPVTANILPFFLSAANRNHIYVTDIDALPDSIMTVSLQLKDGRMKLPAAAGLTVSGDGSQSMPLVVNGTLDDINNALAAGLLVIPTARFLGDTILTITSNDNGNTGEGGVGIDIDQLQVTIVGNLPFNNAPVNQLPPNITTGFVPVILSAATRNEIYITDIDADNGIDFESSLTVTTGSLRLVNTSGITATGNGTPTAPLKLVGPLVAINQALWTGLVYQPPAGLSTATLTIVSNDQGNSGLGGPLTDTDSMTITIVDPNPLINDPPINDLPQPLDIPFAPFLFSLASGNAFSVTDVDAGNAANFEVRFGTDKGVLFLNDVSGLTVSGTGTTFDPLVVVGQIDVINQRFAAGLTFWPISTGRAVISMISDDQGNTGLGGPLRDSDTLEFNVLSTDNSPPVNNLPPNFTALQLPIVLSSNNGNALSVSDLDAGLATDFLVTLSSDSGWLQLPNGFSSNSVRVSGSGQIADPLRLEGRVDDINQLLAQGLTVLPLPGANRVTLEMLSDDRGNTGDGGSKTDIDLLLIEIVDPLPQLNAPPVNHLPPNVVSTSAPVVFDAVSGNQLYVSDIDAGNASNFQVTLTVGAGQLVIANPVGLTVTGTGTLSAPLVLVGVLADIDQALARGLSYIPNGFVGTTTLTVHSDDRGNTGFGGAKTDTDTLQITIVDPDSGNNAPPENHIPNSFVTSQLPVLLSMTNGRPIYVTDIDAGNASNFLVQLDAGQDGILQLIHHTGLTVTGNGSISAPLTLVGSLPTINQRLLEGLLFIPTNGHPTTATITIYSDDRGNTGAGGALTDTDSFQITLDDDSPENNAPVNAVPNGIDYSGSLLVLAPELGTGIQVMDIDAGSATNFEVSLSVTEGQLHLPDSRDLVVTGSGTAGSPLVLTGSLATINERLRTGLFYIAGSSNSALVTVRSNDRGNTGTGGEKSDTDSFRINIIDPDPLMNNPPVNLVPWNFSTDQVAVIMSQANGRLLAVTDVDAGTATNFSVTIDAPSGQLKMLDTAGVVLTGAGTNKLQLIGSLSSINSALAKGVSFMPDAPFVGSYMLTMTSNDNGNTGVGGPMSATSSFQITVVDSEPNRNDPPVNHLPPSIVSDQLPVLLSAANSTNLYVTDIDAGLADVTVTLSVPLGTLALLPGAIVVVTGNGTPATPLVLRGSLLRINAALTSGIQFLPPAGFLGTTQLTILSDDLGNSGSGGPLTDTDVLDISIQDLDPRNNPPVNHVLDNVLLGEDQFVFTQYVLHVTDIDAGNATNFEVSLSVTAGQLIFQGGNRLSFTGNGTSISPLVITGTLADINAAIDGGLFFLPGGATSAQLTITSNDRGNTGAGGALTDTDRMTIRIIDRDPLNQPPVNHLPAPIVTTARTVTLSQANTNPLYVTDIDAGVGNMQVTLTVTSGTLSLANATGVVTSGSGTEDNPLVMTGTLGNINLALTTGLSYQAPADFYGTATLTIVSDDRGFTGFGGAQTDTDTLTITIHGDNAAPRITAIYADSSKWAASFRDFVDGGFNDPSAIGYLISNGQSQYRTLPWVNIDRLKVRFNRDVSGSLDISDFRLTEGADIIALPSLPGRFPAIARIDYDPVTYIATLHLDGFLPGTAIDLRAISAGIVDARGAVLDGEWTDELTRNASGNGVPGGDFAFRFYTLAGDSRDETRGAGTRTVNTNDSLMVRELQNGFALPGFGAIQYDARADLDGNSFINSDDSQYVRDTQNSVMFSRAQSLLGQNQARPWDTNNDQQLTPLDALIVINAINRTMGGAPLMDPNAYTMDVSGDGRLSPIDALLVINALNQRANGEMGEGEASWTAANAGVDQAHSGQPEADDLVDLLAADWISQERKRKWLISGQ